MKSISYAIVTKKLSFSKVIICYILTLDRAVNQRCTYVNKRKKWKQVDIMKEYRQILAAIESVGDKKASQLPDLERPTKGNCPHRPPVEQPQPRCGGSAKWVLEDNTACYGWEKKLGQYSSLYIHIYIYIDVYIYKEVCWFVH